MKLRSVQALRALAAFLVIFDHFPRLENKLFPNGLMHGFGAAGAIGVDLFFVISGFIMVSTSWKAFGAAGASSRFLTRRVLRIYPPYWAALLAFLAIGAIVPSSLAVGPMTFDSVFTSIFLIPHAGGPLLFLAWTLECELYFYCVFAIALHFARERLGLIFTIWCALTLGFNIAAHWTNLTIVQFLGNPLTLEFLGGGLVGYLVVEKRAFAPRTILSVGIVLAAAVALYSSQFDGFGSLNLTWFRVLAAGPAMMLIVYGATTLEQQAQFSPPAVVVAIGDASYSMYLWHGMLLGAYGAVFAKIGHRGSLADVAYIIGGISVVLFGSQLIYRVVELPLLTGAQTLIRRARPSAIAAAAP